MSPSFTFAVGSENPVKINCVAQAVAHFWSDSHVVGTSTDSQVSAQPKSEHEMYVGARNRAEQALKTISAADYGVGIEGGIVDNETGMWAFAVVVIVDRQQRSSEGQTGRFPLPEGVARLIREEGLELGEADDRFFGRQNSKQNEGAIGILSDGRITRLELYKPAVIFALLPFLHPEYYEVNK
ncbi:MAG TPA: inosine/xanthosine triphosphatase [Blastocatellia bacterium]|nr:inosine/xanthosine triphosphatase [Blastocatellia bacterium]